MLKNNNKNTIFDREQRSELGPRSVFVVLLVGQTLRIKTVKNVHQCPLMSINVHFLISNQCLVWFKARGLGSKRNFELVLREIFFLENF